MPRKNPPHPTDAELVILGILWKLGPSTVREVHEAMGRPGAYTTVLKQLQIMTLKGLVDREDSTRTHVYRPRFGEEETQGRLVRHFLDRVFGGAGQKLVLHALAAKPASKEELAEIRRVLDEMEADKL
jgi:predicted transcriptional regulator